MKTCCIIPVRLDSSRLPNKVIQTLGGIKILDRVINIAKACDFEKIVLATDSKYLRTVYNNIDVLLMDEKAWCGSQRAYYVYQKYPKYDYYVTIPSDEPMIDPNELKKSLSNYFRGETELIATMGSDWKEQDLDRYKSSRSCKIITSGDYILYFSRAAVPRFKDDTNSMNHSKKHLGVFIFSKKLFKKYGDKAWSNYKNSIAEVEGLEQTIFLENGFKIRYIPINHPFHGVDTAEDLSALEEKIDNNRRS
jgi:3-deoxy-manno-octulosonate cytidylyltransferase (CMP-KDO synthetase)